MNNKIVIISPFYNEEKSLINHLRNLDNLRKKALKKNYKVNFILVNDGSTDNSLRIVNKFNKNKNYLKVINLRKNQGQQISIYIALKKESNADYYGVIDSDGQQDPLLFLNMIDEIQNKEIEVVQMQKKFGKYEGFTKQVISRFFYFIFTHLTKVSLKAGSSDFYLITKKVRNKIIEDEISKYFLRGFIHHLNFKTKYIKYQPYLRKEGISKYTMGKQLDFALTALYLYGTKIFIKAFIFSLIIMFLSFIFILYSVYEHFFLGSQVKGWASTIVIVTFFGSLNIFFISLVTFFSIKFRVAALENTKI